MDFPSTKVLNYINNPSRTTTMAKWDKNSKLTLNTCPIGHLKVAEVATMTTAIMITTGTIPMVKFTYA